MRATNGGWLHEFEPSCFDSDGHGGAWTLHGVAAAEAVLIERGLGEEYGGELARQLERDGRPMGIDPTQDMARAYSRWILHAATAPLESRVRAMVQVVKQHPKETP